MKLLVLSDLHGNLSIIDRLPRKIMNKIDILVICGDLTHYGNLSDATQILKTLSTLDIPVLFVPGNCDPKALGAPPVIHGAENIHGRVKVVKGLDFIGIGGSPLGPFHTPFEMSEIEITEILNKAYEDSQPFTQFVLVSHSPPLNTKVDLTASGIHAGSKAVREFVETQKPSLVLCGHIHEARGETILNETVLVNPGPAHLDLYAIVDITEGITVNLGRVMVKKVKSESVNES
ncbi:MAG: metallophosphoesterase [Candidatus Bathyarchaeota archaeon]